MSQATCSDSRDKIYSTLGIMDNEEADLIHPDYSTPWQEVYARATYASIKIQRSFGIFDVHCRNSDHLNPSRLPTWTVDFNTVIPTDTNVAALKSLGREYDDGKPWHSWTVSRDMSDFSVHLSPDATRLILDGIVFDTVL
ncbi:hypothetical protein DOTSEDRAFT_129752, partial [Dothistroma septosporum NZE10]